MITDPAGIEFLQWCLPRLHLRWQGFRKVRRQVYKRISGRLQALGLPSLVAYRDYLENHSGEWTTLDSLCWVSISRFYRDQSAFQLLERDILPRLAELALGAGEGATLSCWSVGCAGGEEPYTLAIIWHQRLASQFPSLHLRVVATDIDSQAIRRAERGCYQASSLKQLPPEWRAQAFMTIGEDLCINQEYRGAVTFALQDIRERAPEGVFHLILCRNLVFTYFDETLQREILERLKLSLVPGGVLMIGNLESLPESVSGFAPWSNRSGAYRKV